VQKLRKNLKIALVSGEYPPSSLGGVSTVCYDLAQGLSKNGVDTTVFCGKADKITSEKVNNHLEVVRMPIIRAPPRHLWFPLQNLGPLIGALKRFDIIHCIDTRAAGVLAYFRKNWQGTFVVHVHGCGHCETKAFLDSPLFSWSPGEFVYQVLEYPLNEFLVNASLHHADHAIVCSTARVDEMKRRNPELDYRKVSVIYNGIHLDNIQLDPKAKENECSVLYWGRLFYNKGIMQLIKAMALVKEEFPNVTLDVCGRGPLEAVLKSLTDNLGLKKNVRFHGYVTKEFLTKKIQGTTLITLPSIYEGQPVAVLEALANRKPIVVFDYPFAREYIIDCHNGLIAKACDVKDLAEKICLGLSDKKLRAKLSQNAYQQVSKNHNWDTLIKKYIELYQKLA
jgi:glycosyltransferase involved in cell wall biosynthesis